MAVGSLGGGSVSDNPNRFTFNPSHAVPGSPGGVVLASYTWADDAMRWDAFDDDARYPHALAGLQEIYGQRIEVFYTGAGATQSWARDPYAYGEASVLLPGQHTELFHDIAAPEGPLHFMRRPHLPQTRLDRGSGGIGGARGVGDPCRALTRASAGAPVGAAGPTRRTRRERGAARTPPQPSELTYVHSQLLP